MDVVFGFLSVTISSWFSGLAAVNPEPYPKRLLNPHPKSSVDGNHTVESQPKSLESCFSLQSCFSIVGPIPKGVNDSRLRITLQPVSRP